MIRTTNPSHIAAFLLLTLVPRALSHGDSHDFVVAGVGAPKTLYVNSSTNGSKMQEESYFAYPDHGGLMIGHVALMVVAWMLVLPMGITLSVSRSRMALVVQLSFLAIHSIAVSLGAIYRGNTPDLYKNNVHNKIGWIATWLVVAQCVLGVIRLSATIKVPKEVSPRVPEEYTPFLPTSTDSPIQHESAQAYRYSNDSGHFTASDSSRNQSISSLWDRDDQEQQRKLWEYEEAHRDTRNDSAGQRAPCGNSRIQRLASHMTARISKRTVNFLNTINDAIDVTSLPLGFVAILSGAVVYGGVFRGNNVFNGLAHSIKGGIFFWYGLLTLGRWMGCFAEVGWAWNVRPPVGMVSPRKARLPSAEFVESFVIFLYGASNMWLEHLAAWGLAWSAQDYEHVSISIMFFGGGLCGMLVESQKVRDFLNTTILTSPAAYAPLSTREKLEPPRTYHFSMNPFPGLIILLLGLMMSSHHQASVVATTVHKQWGMLFVGFALARAVTYILTYICPPTSYLPSRPPSELISAFCLISGGLIFIASNKDTVAAMEHHGLHAMFPFTLTMGFTAFLMAWAIIVLAVKGWAKRRQQVEYTSFERG